MREGARALVMASSRNLGAEIARSLAAAGATVAITYHRSAAQAEELVAELSRRDHLALFADTETAAGVSALMDTIEGRWGGVDILVNNSGPFSMVPFLDLDPGEFDRVWDANVTAAYLATRRVAPGMKARGWGRVINVSAVSAAVRNRSIYGLAKAAVEGLTEALALELAPEITVNAVAPGQIAESLADMAARNPDWARSVTDKTPLRRLVTRRQVAELVALLCTPAFDVLTGATIPVDGGLRLPHA